MILKKTFSIRYVLLIIRDLLVLLLLNLSVTYGQSSCISGNCIDGIGKCKFPSGAIFEGSFVNGQIFNGKYSFTNGDVYTGYFKNNLFDGEGKYEYKISGNIFVGTYFQGDKTKGTFYYSDGSKYIGCFKNHKKDGKGKLITAKGKIFEGYWEADMFIGNKERNKVNTYAVIVGIADYKNFTPGSGDLNFPVNDARKFYMFLQSIEGGNVPVSNIKLLINSDASLQNIIKTGSVLFSEADNNDRIIFFFSGHGSREGFIPSDVDLQGKNILTHEQIKQLFANSKASVKIIFADACHSGSIIKANPNEVINEKNFQNEINVPISKNYHQNVAVMMSSSENQVSFEYPTLNQGVFSFYLMAGLSGKADKNNDNLITMEEIYYYVRDNTYNFVKKNIGYVQTPLLFGNFDLEMIIGAY